MKASKEMIIPILERIREERKTLPEFSFFGDNNWESLDSQIARLELALAGIYPPPADLQCCESEGEEDCVEWLLDSDSTDYGEEL